MTKQEMENVIQELLKHGMTKACILIDQLQQENEELKKQVDQLQKQNENALNIIDRMEYEQKKKRM